MSKPTISGSPVPMFHVRGNMDDRTGQNLHGSLTLFLIPTPSGNTDKHLPATFRCTMDVPIIATTRFKRNIGNRNLLTRNRGEVAITNKILRVCRIRLADRKNHFTLESSFSIITCRIFCPHSLGQIKCSPRLRPTGIKSYMGDNLGNFSTRDSVLFCRLKVKNKRTIRNTLTNEGGNGY